MTASNATGILALASAVAGGAATLPPLSSRNDGVIGRGAHAACAPAEEDVTDKNQRRTTFAPGVLHYDHYGGVTLSLDEGASNAYIWGDDGADSTNGVHESDFASVLASSVEAWGRQGKKGIWIHVPAQHADKVQAAVAQGFEFHMVVSKTLVLTKWLDAATPSRLPPGPTHQVGVGCLVLHPDDPGLMLVVQEKSGPAAAFGLWKMPTGLADAGEDIHDAAVRELQEETGLKSSFVGVLTFRQAHPTGKGAVSRANSDLFFVCRLQLTDYDEKAPFEACPTEIAAIRWMPVKDYCAQERWQGSPVYVEMNRAILEASRHVMFGSHTLPLGFSGGTNSLYKSQPT
jgi:8-oxo-dGTP pyrophosphatase MutT (NUDIX family)